MNDQIQAASHGATQVFYEMVEDIRLNCKVQNLRIAEIEESAAPNDCALSGQSAERDSRWRVSATAGRE